MEDNQIGNEAEQLLGAQDERKQNKHSRAKKKRDGSRPQPLGEGNYSVLLVWENWRISRKALKAYSQKRRGLEGKSYKRKRDF